MDKSIKWTLAALDDLEQIAEYIGRDSQFYAAGVVQEVFTAAESIGRLPLASGIVPEFEDESIREILVRRYRMIYQVRDESVHMLAIVHGARDLPDAWDDRAHKTE